MVNGAAIETGGIVWAASGADRGAGMASQTSFGAAVCGSSSGDDPH